LSASGTHWDGTGRDGTAPAATLDTKAIEQALGAPAGCGAGLPGHVRERRRSRRWAAAVAGDGRRHGDELQPTSDGKAAITGDFVLIDKEVNAWPRRFDSTASTSLRSTSCAHGQPRLFYMHFWATTTDEAAQALKAALDQTNSRK